MLNNEDYLNIFHEIKNSITLIASSLQLVEKKHPEVNTFDYWNEAMSEIAFLKGMVTELSAARLTNRENFKLVDLCTFIDSVINAMRAFTCENFHYEVELASPTAPVKMDATLMKQAITNLLKNAYEAMNCSGTVRIVISTIKDHAQISIIDQGGGLDPSFADNIFEPFITSKTGGSGLGLAITKQIIEFHQGTLTYESRVDDGCTFTVTLPFNQS